MKIIKTSKDNKISSLKRAKSTSSAEGFMELMGGHASEETQSADPLFNVSDVALLSNVDNVEEREARRNKQKAIKWGEDLLDGLKDLRDSFLNEDITEEKLKSMMSALKKKGDFAKLEDDGLNDALSAVEVRAQVEAAKLRKAMKGSK